MKFYNIIMIHKRHISKKLIWSGTENMQNHPKHSCCKIACFWAIFCATSNHFFWYVPLVYHYYIIESHHLGLDRLSKKIWRWCAHQAHFLWSFLKFEKKIQILWANPHVFERFFNFFNRSLKLFFLIFTYRASS